jgi:hypothetical protein
MPLNVAPSTVPIHIILSLLPGVFETPLYEFWRLTQTPYIRRMDEFSYLSVLISVILGLAVTQILKGFRGILLSRTRAFTGP